MMTDFKGDFVYAAPDSLLGQLQRGRGAGARRAVSEGGAGDLVMECVLRDTRWDAQTESRHHYLARLIYRLEVPLDAISAYLFGGSVHEDSRDVELSLSVLGWLVEAGRRDAVPLLRRYVAEGEHLESALWAVDWSRADLWTGLDEVVLGRLDDQELAAVFWSGEPWSIWARGHSRVRALFDVREEERKRRARAEQNELSRKRVAAMPTTEIVARIGPEATSERRDLLRELGNRGDLVLLELAERPRLRNAYGRAPGMSWPVLALGTAAVPRAREWTATSDEFLQDLALEVLADSGDATDAPYLLETFELAVCLESWYQVSRPAQGLGRLGFGAATTQLAAAWDVTPFSRARGPLLEGLRGCAPATAEALAGEGLEDCEEQVREISCEIAPLTPYASELLREMSAGPPETRHVQSLAATRLGERPSNRGSNGAAL